MLWYKKDDLAGGRAYRGTKKVDKDDEDPQMVNFEMVNLGCLGSYRPPLCIPLWRQETTHDQAVTTPIHNQFKKAKCTMIGNIFMVLVMMGNICI